MGPALRKDELQGRLRFLGWGEEAGGWGFGAVLGGFFGGGWTGLASFFSLEVGGGWAGDFGR